jgi:hypothetical protein
MYRIVLDALHLQWLLSYNKGDNQPASVYLNFMGQHIDAAPWGLFF